MTKYDPANTEPYEQHVRNQIQAAFRFGRGVTVSPAWLEQVLAERKLAEQHYGELREMCDNRGNVIREMAEHIVAADPLYSVEMCDE